jgi:hypothetical protein
VVLGAVIAPGVAYADTYDGPVERIVNDRSDRCLDQDWSDGVAHSDPLAWVCSTAVNQQWRVTSQGNGYFTIRNVRTSSRTAG